MTYSEAMDYLKKKGIEMCCARQMELGDQEPNVLYIGKPKSWLNCATGDSDYIAKAKAEGKLVAEIPFVGNHLGWNVAIIQAAEVVKAQMGQVRLSDPVDIPYADKGQVAKLITRLKRSTTKEELEARAEELQALSDLYEGKESDTERDDLADKYQAICNLLEDAQEELGSGNKEAAISTLEDVKYE